VSACTVGASAALLLVPTPGVLCGVWKKWAEWEQNLGDLSGMLSAQTQVRWSAASSSTWK